MNRSGPTLIGVLLVSGTLLVSCSQPVAAPPLVDPTTSPERAVTETATPPPESPPSVADGDPAVTQRVKNICLKELQNQASGATPAPGQRRPVKVTLVKIAFSSGLKQITLADGASGYELGIDYTYKVGHNDSMTGRKYCRTDADVSTVDWQWTPSP